VHPVTAPNRARRNVCLLALDGSPSANRAARYVARAATKFSLDALHLVNARLPGVGDERLTVAAREAHAREDAMRATARARATLERAGLSMRFHVVVGTDPAALIAAVAEQIDAAEIVMGTRGVSRLGSVTLGSMAYKVLHLTRRSVTLVPHRSRASGERPADLRNLLLAVDGSAVSDRAAQFVARQAAGVPGVRVVLFNVQPRIVSENVRRFATKSQIDRDAEQEAAAAMQSSMRILRRAGIEYEPRVARGAVVQAILEIAADARCGRIVLGTRGRSAAKSVLLGSVAYGVVHQATVPVTVVDRMLPAPAALPAARTA
jgi:nucleotide-binding universal stress UspA family protein